MPKNVILKGEICHGNQMNLKSDPVQRNVYPAVGLFCDFVIAVYWWEKLYWSSALEFVTLNPPPVPKWLQHNWNISQPQNPQISGDFKH